MLVSLLLAVVGGLLVTAAFEPVGLAVLAPLGVAGVVLAVHRLRDRRPVVALVPGVAFGVAFMVPLLSWLRVIGPDAWLVSGVLTGLFYAAWALAAVLLVRLPGWPLWVSLAWVATETVRGAWPFGGFPWGRLAQATAGTPYASGLPWWGSTGVSLLVAGTGVVLAWAVLSVRRQPRLVAGTATALVALVAVPWLAPYDATPAGGGDADGAPRTARIVAVQGDVPGPGDDVLFDSSQLTANHVEATEELAAEVDAGRTPRPDLVVWPENSTTVDPFGTEGLSGEVGRGIDTAVAAIDAPVLVGAIVDAPTEGQVLNQGVVFSPGTGAGERYTKWHPVPFGEFIPFRDSALLGGVTAQVERLDLVARDMLAGTRTEPLDVGGIAVAAAICFDVAYDDGIYAQVDGGADVLVVQTSNALFIDTAQIDQQFEITRLRAIETGRTTVVAAINGVSGVIGPDGRVLETADPRTRAVLEADVVLADGTPPAIVVGPWLGRAAGLLTVLALVAALLRRSPYRRAHGAPRGEDARERREEEQR